MIPVIAPFRARVRGDVLMLRAPDGSTIHYRERVRPLRRISTIVRDVLARDPEFVLGQVAKPERLVTAEGEQAVLTTAMGTRDGVPERVVIGVVYGDDFHSLLVGASPAQPASRWRAICRELLLADSLALGPRRRRFTYAPPRGWRHDAHGLASEWTPGVAGDSSLVIVAPASPAPADAEGIAAALLAADRAAGEITSSSGPHVDGTHPFGLRASLWAWIARLPDAPLVHRMLAVLEDGQYVYPVRLEHLGGPPPPASLEAFRALCASVRPIPVPRAAAPQAASVAMWAD